MADEPRTTEVAGKVAVAPCPVCGQQMMADIAGAVDLSMNFLEGTRLLSSSSVGSKVRVHTFHLHHDCPPPF